MIEKITCQVCGRTVKMSTDDELHYSNWSLTPFGSSETVEVCSVGCREIARIEYALELRKSYARHLRHNEEFKELAESILKVFRQPDGTYSVGSRPQSVVWDIRRILADHDC